MTAPTPRAAGERTDQRFADALCGPDGTGDPTVLMPVLQTYPDALSAPMPDAMVTVPPLDLAAALAAVRQPLPAPPSATSPARVPQPGRYGRNPAAVRAPDRAPRPAPSVGPRGPAPRPPQAPHAPLPPPTSTPSMGRSGQAMSPAELAGFLRATFTGVTQGAGRSGLAPGQPQAHVPSPPLPRRVPRTTRRNKGSSIWAVIVFLVVIAFASGIAQQLIHAISELFGR